MFFFLCFVDFVFFVFVLFDAILWIVNIVGANNCCSVLWVLDIFCFRFNASFFIDAMVYCINYYLLGWCASLNLDSTQCGTRFAILSHCQFVFISFNLSTLQSSWSAIHYFSLTCISGSLMSVFNSFSGTDTHKHTHDRPIHSCLWWSNRSKDAEKSRCFKYKLPIQRQNHFVSFC